MACKVSFLTGGLCLLIYLSVIYDAKLVKRMAPAAPPGMHREAARSWHEGEFHMQHNSSIFLPLHVPASLFLSGHPG